MILYKDSNNINYTLYNLKIKLINKILSIYLNFNGICYLIMITDLLYLFYNFNEIKIPPEQFNNFNLLTQTHLKNPVKFLIWRNLALLIIIPLILSDFIINLCSYYKTYNHIQKTNEYGPYLKNSEQTLNYIRYYYIFTSIFSLY